MNKNIKEVIRSILEHRVDVIIALVFFSICFFIVVAWLGKYDYINKNDLIMPSIVMVGMFLAWIQYLSNKSTQRKEAALTYYPRPMELEKIENEIDRVINFWSSSYAMASHEVKLMLDEEITHVEYQLCWDRLSNQVKREIVDTYKKYHSKRAKLKSSSNPNIVESNIHKLPSQICGLEYCNDYAPLIKERFIDIRRKFHLYLNQIEGFCLALNKGNIDSKTAREMYVHKLENHFRKAKPYIDAVRAKRNAPEIYIQFEKVIDKWKIR